MARRCSVNTKKGVQSGHRVSHSQRKTKHKFMPNLQNISFFSDVLNRAVRLRISVNGARTVEHNDGIDNFLLNARDNLLDKSAIAVKRQIISAKSKQTTEAA